jgi:hypothetical protein
MLAIEPVNRLRLMALSDNGFTGQDLLRNVNSLGKQHEKFL